LFHRKCCACSLDGIAKFNSWELIRSLALLVAITLMMCSTNVALAVDPNKTINQYGLDGVAERFLAQVQPVFYDTTDGLKTSQASFPEAQPAGWRTVGGELWLAAKKGLVIIDPANIPNNDGVWNFTGASASFALEPHIYQTVWFYALCILLVITGAAGAQRLHTRALRARAAELSRVVAERTEELRKEIAQREQFEKRTQALSDLKQHLLDSRGLNDKLKSITDAIVEIFGADFARIWITRSADLCEKGCHHAEVLEGPNACTNRTRCLHLVASSGRYTCIDGEHRRVPLGCYKIGRVASGVEAAFITNDVTNDPAVHDREWARTLGLVSFAGYQLVSEQGEPIGVMALFRKSAIAPEEETFLRDLAATTSQVVKTGLSKEALRTSEESFRSLFENSVLGVYQTSPEGEVLLANPALCRMLGYESLEELGRRNLEGEGFHPSYPRRAFKKEVEEKGLIVGLEATWHRRDGTTIFVRESARAIRDISGKVLYYEGTVEDITERKRAEEELRESRQLLKLVLDSIPVRVFWKDRNSKYLGCNRPFAVDAGLSSPDVIIGKNDFEMPWLEQAELYRADDRLVIESGMPKLNYEEPQTTAEGLHIWLRTSKVPLIDATGQVRGVMGTYEDITERKRAEEALRKSEEKYRRYFEQNLAGYCVTSVEGKFLVCNPAFLAMFGLRSMGEAAEVKVDSLYPSREAREEFLDMLKRKKRVDLHEMELRRLDGSAIHVVENVVGVFDEQGQLTEIHRYMMDDTKRWKIEQQFIQAQKMEAVGSLTAGIAHDFNNMLAVIRGFSDLLLEQIGRDDSRHRSIEQIQKAGNRAAALTRQLLAFSRQQVLEPRVVDLNEIVSGSANLVSRVIGEDINLNVVLSPSPCAVKVDMTQIEQVIMNLAVNARDAMPNGGQLTIETKSVTLDEGYTARHHPMTPGTYAMLTVSDTGTGMDAATRARVFEPFFTTKERGKGTGLGLAAVYGIVKQSGGYIWVYSELGLGTTFKIYLPLSEKAARAEEVREPSSQSKLWTETILLVEDEPSVREVVHQMLTDVGYTVLEAGGPEEASKIVEMHEKPIALLLTDVVMPGANGRLLADELVALRPAMKVLYMSGYTDDIVIRQGGLQPGLAFIQKPFSRDGLTKKIRELLG
jgi:PAS domain S-box-containing protein